MVQQTAINYAIQKIKLDFEANGRMRPAFVYQVLEEAKAMEKEQIVKARLKGGCIICDDGKNTETGEQYYKENYG